MLEKNLRGDHLRDRGAISKVFIPISGGGIGSEGESVVSISFLKPLSKNRINGNVGHPEVDLLNRTVLYGSVDNARAMDLRR
jgi:hypothetical protein